MSSLPAVIVPAVAPAVIGDRSPVAVRESSDDALAALAAADDRAAFDELARRFQGPLLRFLLRSTLHRADSEDALQDTFRRLYAARRRRNEQTRSGR